ncbi:GNAT family N-acetyltransferase [Leifsonia sp. NPDC058292]|uniref:GNAT family N-acetyltransferase n=1 Tax=Leifsonia sp. NPDC058292 TaxID=3346428 RepID=UPI0036DAADC3
METENIKVEAIRADLWPQLAEVFGEPGDASGCWCQWFKLTGTQNRELPRDAKAARLRESIAGDPAPGVIAWINDEPVGWAAVEPFSAYPSLGRSPITKRLADDPLDPWAVTCFVVRHDFRRRGVAAALLRGAVDHATAQGAVVVEGYPVDTAVRPSLSSAERYHGTVSLFESAGFHEVRRPSATRAVMRFEPAA